MAKVKGPLKPEHLVLLNKVIKECTETAEQCKRCDSCNMDVDKEREENAEQLDTAMKLKATFFPQSK